MSMSERKRTVRLVVTLNLLLWVMSAGATIHAGIDGVPLWTALAGALYAAVWEHREYYSSGKGQQT